MRCSEERVILAKGTASAKALRLVKRGWAVPGRQGGQCSWKGSAVQGGWSGRKGTA